MGQVPAVSIFEADGSEAIYWAGQVPIQPFSCSSVMANDAITNPHWQLETGKEAWQGPTLFLPEAIPLAAKNRHLSWHNLQKVLFRPAYAQCTL